MKIDLHAHTNYSDGELSPKELVQKAIKKGIKYLAIADHDTVKGVQEAIDAAKNKDLTVIPATEITALLDKEQVVHIVGLNINMGSEKIKQILKKAEDFRIKKTKIRIKEINKYFKSNITYKEVQSKTKGFPATPHLAIVLMEKGYLNSLKEGMDIITGPTSPIRKNIKYEIPTAKEVIQAIQDAGGIAILAHLVMYKIYGKFTTLKEQEELAKNYKLLISCGSDFHGKKLHPKNKLGFLDIEKEKITILKNLKYLL